MNPIDSYKIEKNEAEGYVRLFHTGNQCIFFLKRADFDKLDFKTTAVHQAVKVAAEFSINGRRELDKKSCTAEQLVLSYLANR